MLQPVLQLVSVRAWPLPAPVRQALVALSAQQVPLQELL